MTACYSRQEHFRRPP